MSVVIYHNPRCSKSRQTLELLEKNGVTPEVVKYLDTPLNVDELKALYAQLGFSSVREMMRTKEDVYKELGLGEASVSDEQLFEAMAQNPKLFERPVVVANGKAKIGRPPEQVLDIL
ncbi:arsenate reductase (glutaredoxin) [Vibrio parahaemolyticus]|uniref:arsenate reductase (glutaredoxin) n=1 Tax=Vibrio parahaemolyticus TaxID=670 RepID=UPI00084A99E2|nr:arsenate reductase (glutaredoxin) [Vibrio parahaemolyticus]EGR1546144.1 arsenate reductase (glutaredoxin) [Vibrio parahaemolyticus]EGR2216513.1 arsenate reductase (glutaredoxin) [Vibrio parahaemolyticus]EIE1272213.1 arsenate reductase (glutaredoxin) [Vibrio parahaemolyticus]EJG0588532.1 arsenate reductase (glutaredoxin) [Vibrio parahaemolyticus]ELA8109201.1 arsenate reductase (glutaredoxin) [Vibrio parahaemolyticus]